MAKFSHQFLEDKEEYYPGRSLIDAVSEEPDNDFPVRPATCLKSVHRTKTIFGEVTQQNPNRKKTTKTKQFYFTVAVVILTK